MEKLSNYEVVELEFALRHYIRYCNEKGLEQTRQDMLNLKEKIAHADIYLSPFNT